MNPNSTYLNSIIQQQGPQLPPDDICFVKKYTNLDNHKHNSNEVSRDDENAKENEDNLTDSILMSDLNNEVLEETPNAIYHMHQQQLQCKKMTCENHPSQLINEVNVLKKQLQELNSQIQNSTRNMQQEVQEQLNNVLHHQSLAVPRQMTMAPFQNNPMISPNIRPRKISTDFETKHKYSPFLKMN